MIYYGYELSQNLFIIQVQKSFAFGLSLTKFQESYNSVTSYCSAEQLTKNILQFLTLGTDLTPLISLGGRLIGSLFGFIFDKIQCISESARAGLNYDVGKCSCEIASMTLDYTI